VASLNGVAGLTDRLSSLRLEAPAANVALHGRRYASVKSQGAYKLRSNKTIPKKLGAKRTGDQYVIPGNILYKQRGTIWHPGENTILGRDHTIHAAVAGYVKYYRDPLRHPKRQYIGVVFNKDDKLPYPVGAPRKRKLGLFPTPRKTVAVDEDNVSPSGLPLWVTRKPSAAAAEEAEEANKKLLAAASKTITRPEVPADGFKDGNSIITYLLKERATARAEHRVKVAAKKAADEVAMAERRNTRVLRLQSDYSYRESNWEIGRLVGDVGKVAGTEKVGSRKNKLRSRRHKADVRCRGIKQAKLDKAARRDEYHRRVAAKRVIRQAERAEFAAKEQARLAAKGDAPVAKKA